MRPAARPRASASRRGRGPARPCSLPHRRRYLVWGWGQGSRKGLGQMSPVVAAATEAAAPVGKISAATTRPLGPKWENSVSDGGGRGRKPGIGRRKRQKRVKTRERLKASRDLALPTWCPALSGRPHLLALGTRSGRSFIERKWRSCVAPGAGCRFVLSQFQLWVQSSWLL